MRSKLTYLIFVLAGLYSFVLVFLLPVSSHLKEGEQILSGQVASEIMSGDNFDRLILNVDVSEIKGQKIYIQEKVLIYIPKYQNINYSDRLILKVTLQKPKNFLNENNIEFNYIGYLQKEKIFWISYDAEILEHVLNSDFDLIRQLFFIKKKFISQTTQIFESPQVEILNGVLLGDKKSLGENLEKNFRRVGLIHIVVLSGFNVTIIGIFLINILAFLPQKLKISLGIIAIFMFSIMVGSGATVIRSAIMSSLGLIAKTGHLKFNVNKALFLAGSVMIFINPGILFYDPSFQLSFLATFGLINFSPFFEKIFKFLPNNFVKEIWIATLSTQAGVLFLLIKMTGEMSVIAPLINILVLPLIPVLMLLGFIAVFFSFFNFELGLFISFFPDLILSYILWLVNYFGNLSWVVWKF